MPGSRGQTHLEGGEIYYVDADEQLTVVTVRPSTDAGTEGDLRFGPPRALFRVDSKEATQRQFDTLDGETFIVNRTRRVGSRSPLTLVLNVP